MPHPLAAVRELRGPLAVLASMLFVGQLGIGVMLPIIPLYAISLGASPRDLGLLTTAFSLANVVAQLGTGFFLDRIDLRLPIRTGIGTYGAANFLDLDRGGRPFTGRFGALAGLGAGANLVADRVYLSRIADPARLAYLNGLLGSAASAGALMGPAIGGLLAQVADLRAPFIVVAATSGIALVACCGSAPPRRPSPLVARRLGLQPLRRGPADGEHAAARDVRRLHHDLRAGTRRPRSAGPPRRSGSSSPSSRFGSLAAAPMGAVADRRGRRLVGTYATLPALLFMLALVFALPRPLIYVSASPPVRA